MDPLEQMAVDEEFRVTKDGWIVTPMHLHAMFGTRLPDGTLFVDFCPDVMECIKMVVRGGVA